MTDIFLYQGEANPKDVKLRDPTTPSGGGTVGEDSWHQRFSDPTANFAARLRAAAFVALVASGAIISPWALTQPEQVNESNWHQEWSRPSRLRPPLPVSLTDPLLVTTPETVTVDKWYTAFGEVTRSKGLRTQLQSSGTIDPWALTQKENVTEDRWHQPFSDPTTNWADLRLNRYQIAQVASGMGPGGQGATIAPEIVTLDKWYASLSEWPRQPKGLRSQLQLASAISPWALTQPETTSADRWYVELSQPFRRPSPAGRYPNAFDAIQFGTVPVVVNCDSWYTALSQPTYRVKSPPSYLADLAYPGLMADSWFSALSQPSPRRIPSLIGALSWTPWQGPLLEWYGPLSEPTRRPATRQLQQQYVPFLQAILSSSWYAPLSEPVRVKRRPEGGLYSIVNTSVGPAPVSIVGATRLYASKVTITLLGSKPTTILLGSKPATSLKASKPVTILLGGKSTINLKGEVKK